MLFWCSNVLMLSSTMFGELVYTIQLYFIGGTMFGL
uniref:Uncharacterized protein n=1 Tax=Arundo donax TaxID=35708 RepID=A0A0A8YYI5_ARUDO